MVRHQSQGATPLAAADFSAGGRAVGEAAQRFGATLGNFAEEQDAIAAQLDQAAAKKADNAYAEWSRKRLWTDDGASINKRVSTLRTLAPGWRRRSGRNATRRSPGRRRLACGKMMSDALDRRINADLEASRAIRRRNSGSRPSGKARRGKRMRSMMPLPITGIRRGSRKSWKSGGARSARKVGGPALRRKWCNMTSPLSKAKVYAQVGSRLIRTGKIEDASAWVEEHRSSMQPGDLEDLDAALYHPLLERQADGIVDDLLGYAPASTAGQSAAAGATSSQYAGRAGGSSGANVVRAHAPDYDGRGERRSRARRERAIDHVAEGRSRRNASHARHEPGSGLRDHSGAR